MRRRRNDARVGEAPPVEIATTTSPRSTMAGMTKSQSPRRSATFTGTPAELRHPLGGGVVIGMAGCDESGDGTAEVGCA